MKIVKTKYNGNKEVFKDEIFIEMISALGSDLGSMSMPAVMKDGIIKSYLESKAVRTTYMYINGKEITDGINYNPFYHIK